MVHPEVRIEKPTITVSSTSSFDVSRFREKSKNRLITEYIGKQSYERPYTTVGELLNCVRQNYYYRLKYQIDLDKNFNFVYLKLYGDVGTAIHKYTQDTYGFSEVEKPIFSEKYKVKGKADAVDGNILYELKTTEYFKFKNKYEEDHYNQGNIYAYLLNSEYGYSIRNVTIVYFFRDSLKKDPIGFDLPVNKDLAMLYLSRSSLLLEALRTKVVPNKIGSSADKCKYCMYQNHCEKEEIIQEETKKAPLRATTSFKM